MHRVAPTVILTLLTLSIGVCSAGQQADDSVIMAARRAPAATLSEMFTRLTLQAPPSSTPRRAMIIPFSSIDSGRSGRSAAEYAVVHFSGQPDWTVVDRTTFETAMKEIALSQSGAIADSLALSAGKQLSANCLVTGSVAQSPGRKTFFARLVDIETGRILSAAVADVKETELTAMYKEAFGERSSAAGTIFRSTILPGWGQFYVKHPGHGAVSLITFAGTAGVLAWSLADYTQARNTAQSFADHDPSTAIPGELPDAWAARANNAVSAQNDAATRSTILCGALAGVWALNLIDAAILGHRDSKKVRNLYFSAIPKNGSAELHAAIAFKF